MKRDQSLVKLLLVLSGIGLTATTQAADYTWTAATTANWATANWAGTPPVNVATGPVAGDNIFFAQSAARSITLGASRTVNNITSNGTSGWTFGTSAAGVTALLTANDVNNLGSHTIQFRNGNETAILNVALANLTLNGTAGASITAGGTAAAETATNWLNSITVSGETRIVQGTVNFNVRNAANTSNTFSLGLLNMSAGTMNLNQSYASKNAEVNLRGLTGTGGTVTGVTTITGGSNTGTTSIVITATGQYSSGTVLTDGASGGKMTVTKAGAGTQVLTGASTYTGGTTITAGRLQLGSGGTTGSIAGNVATGATTEFAFNRSNAYTFSGTISGDGTVIQEGGGTTTFSAANTYSGDTAITAGTLLVSNASGSGTGTGSVTVAAGAALGGSGIIAPDSGNNVTIAGSLTPGLNNAGVITFGLTGASKLEFLSGATVEMTLGTVSDQVAFSATGDWLVGSGNAALNLTLGSGFDYNASYVIFDNVSTSGFDFASVNGYDSGAYTHSFSQVGDDYVLSFTAVPEPSTVALFGLAGAMGLFAWRRNRRSTTV